MKYDLLLGKYKVSKVGIGGHYSKMEEGNYEERYALVNKSEIDARRLMIEKAFDAGITYYDTTWRNEVDMLSESIRPLNIRDKIFINGMVLGIFSGSNATNLTPVNYTNKWLDERIKVIPGNYLDSFMINAIEESFDESFCEEVVAALEKRRRNGDFKVLGFSCHNHKLARKIADKFPQFEIIMTAYNYKNRAFEEAFEGYSGKAEFVAMKPLIWHEYGIPFCSINNLQSSDKALDCGRVLNIAEKSIKWSITNPKIKTCVCAVNNMDELNSLIAVGDGELTTKDFDELSSYQNAIEKGNQITLLISAIMNDVSNTRSLYFGLTNLATAIGYDCPNIPLNVVDTDSRLLKLKGELINVLTAKGYDKYF